MSHIKKWLQKKSPNLLYKILSYSNVYRKRVYTWFQIVTIVRGFTLKDEAKLLFSACLGLFLSLRHLSEWQDPILLWNARVKVHNIGVFCLRAKTDDLHHINRYREPEIFDEIKKILHPGDLFIDAGANIGFYTVLGAKKVGENGRVVTIEMLPENNRILKEMIDINELQNVELISMALSDKTGEEITISVPKEKFGQASIIKKKGDFDKSITVETVRLDALIDKNKSIKLLKIDTEGAEKLVLNGSEGILANIRNIIFEMYDDDENKEKVFNFLQSHDFQMNQLGGKDYLAVRL